jgi:hypothetical protein
VVERLMGGGWMGRLLCPASAKIMQQGLPLFLKGCHQGLVIRLVSLHHPDGVVNGTELTFSVLKG